MNELAAANYRGRMARVLDHIDRHPDGDLRLEALADIAAFSKFHSIASSARCSACRYNGTCACPA